MVGLFALMLLLGVIAGLLGPLIMDSLPVR